MGCDKCICGRRYRQCMDFLCVNCKLYYCEECCEYVNQQEYSDEDEECDDDNKLCVYCAQLS